MMADMAYYKDKPTPPLSPPPPQQKNKPRATLS